MILLLALAVVAVVALTLYFTHKSSGCNGRLARLASSSSQQQPVELQWIAAPYPGGKHGTATPAAALDAVSQELGQPDSLDPTAGGQAVWKAPTLKKKGYCFSRVVLRDEQVPVDDHVEFLYVSYKIKVPQWLLSPVRNLTPSLQYDTETEMLTVRGNSMQATVIPMVLVKRMVTQQLRPQDAEAMLKPWMNDLLLTEHAGDYQAYLRELYKYQVSLAYYSNCCPELRPPGVVGC